jgi:methionyl-tRNA formyltransferase
MTKSIRIVFMGTPDFAVSSLAALLNEGFNVVGVVTAPDRPAGRGMKNTSSAVKQFALEKDLTILQPEKLRDPNFLQALRDLQADLQVVVAFRMLPEVVWNMPPMGTINVHASLLPAYRGAAPINWAIINGEKETGVTTFKLSHEIDTGNLLLQDKVMIGEDETAGELHETLKQKGAALLIKTIQRLLDGELIEQPQTAVTDHVGQLPHAPKIFTDTCRIEFDRPVAAVHNFIRGLSPIPGAFTKFQGRLLKIYKSKPELIPHNQPSGSFDTDGQTFFRFFCPDGYISVLELQPEGKRRMQVEDYIRGLRIA